MKLYGIPNCNSVKKARVWLDQQGITYHFHDFKKLGLDRATAEHWLQQLSWEKLINRKGTTWRALSEAEKMAVVDAQSALALIQAKISVIKRPIIVQDQRIIALGFDAAEYAQLFAKE